jgi:transposase-like protein
MLMTVILLMLLGVAELGYDKFIVRSPKNNTSKNAELMQCPECQSTHVNKNGQKKGKQNYICVGCGRQFIDCYQPHKGYSEEVKGECLKMYSGSRCYEVQSRVIKYHFVIKANESIFTRSQKKGSPKQERMSRQKAKHCNGG